MVIRDSDDRIKEAARNLYLLDEDRLDEMEQAGELCCDEEEDSEYSIRIGIQDTDRMGVENVFEYLSNGHQIGDNVDIDSVIFGSVPQRLRKIEI